ncbi:MAG: hypothetical protein HY558_01750 [Euryarchaeota archaeon]|nr:hypothetical protein [Euryarchaeota archaeon]
MFYGIKTGFDEAFDLTVEQRAKILSSSPRSEDLIKPILGGQDIRRYHIRDSRRYQIVIPAGWTRENIARDKNSTKIPEKEAWSWFSKNYQAIAKHLEPFTDACRKRQDKGDFWWELRPCDYYNHIESPKIIFPDICKEPRFYLDLSSHYLTTTAFLLGSDDRYLLGLLNSNLFWFAISNLSIPFGIRAGKYRYRLKYQYMEKVPIRPISPSDPADRAAHDEIVRLVERMLDLHKKRAPLPVSSERERVEREIAATDERIDEIVYRLYGITGEERKIIESGGGRG